MLRVCASERESSVTHLGALRNWSSSWLTLALVPPSTMNRLSARSPTHLMISLCQFATSDAGHNTMQLSQAGVPRGPEKHKEDGDRWNETHAYAQKERGKGEREAERERETERERRGRESDKKENIRKWKHKKELQ